MSSSNIEYPKVTKGDVIKEFLRVSRKFKYAWIVAVLSMVMAVLANSIFAPIYYKRFFDTISNSVASSAVVPDLVVIIFYIFGLNILGWVLYRIYYYVIVKIQSGTMHDLRQNAYNYAIGHSYAFFSNTFSGSLVQKINRFMRAFERMTDRIFSEVVPIITKVIGVCVVLWYVQPMLAIAIVVWMACFFVISHFLSRWKIPYDIKSAETESKATASLADSLSNHNTIQLFSRHSFESALFGLSNRTHIDAMEKKWTVAGIIDGIQALINVVVELLIFYFAVKYWGAGVLSIGTFVLIQMYVIGLMDNFWGWSRILRDMYESFADAKEMVEVMKLSHGIKDLPEATRLKVESGSIDFTDVAFAFHSGKSVLGNFNLKIKAGEKVAFIGPSGAGKSTLVRLLLRLYDVQNGAITIDGQDIKKVTQNSLREVISFVPQDPILFHRSLKDNIRYGRLDATDEEIVDAAKKAHCHDFILALPQGYDTFVGERGIKLSGGERQRVAIARAILKNAPILVLDEATSSLDSHSEMLIQDALDVLMKGKTVIVIAHRLSTIRKMDRIVVIDNGSISEEGSHDALVDKNGLYARLWSLQSHGFIK